MANSKNIIIIITLSLGQFELRICYVVIKLSTSVHVSVRHSLIKAAKERRDG